MASTTTIEDVPSLETQIRELLSPSLLQQVHNVRFPWSKASRISWQAVTDDLWGTNPEIDRTLYKLLFPIWLAMSKKSFEQLIQVDLPKTLLDCSWSNYPALSTALVYILDQSRPFFRGTDMRYTHSFFEPLAAQTAFLLLVGDEGDDEASGSGGGNGTGIPPPTSPFSASCWLTRGWTFEDYAIHVDWLWSALIHSEFHMSQYRALNVGFLRYLRGEVEAFSGKRDPFAATQTQDEADLSLLPRLTGKIGEGELPSSAKLGRELDVADYVFWILRVNTAHFPIIDRFGRYPYQNDQMGREFQDGEEEWMGQVYPRSRLPVAWREAIRRDVDAGRWTELKGDSRFD